jgi:hypothetical protein
MDKYTVYCYAIKVPECCLLTHFLDSEDVLPWPISDRRGLSSRLAEAVPGP